MEASNPEMEKIIENLATQLKGESKAFGKKSRPREMDPSMNQLLSWSSPKPSESSEGKAISFLETKLSKNCFQKSSLLKKLTNLMEKQSEYSTETRDNFRNLDEKEIIRFAYKAGLFDLLSETSKTNDDREKAKLVDLMESSKGMQFVNQSPLEYKREHFQKLLEMQEAEEKPDEEDSGHISESKLCAQLLNEELMRCENETQKKIKIFQFLNETQDLSFLKSFFNGTSGVPVDDEDLGEDDEEREHLKEGEGLDGGEVSDDPNHVNDFEIKEFLKQKTKQMKSQKKIKVNPQNLKMKKKTTNSKSKKSKKEREIQKIIDKFTRESRWLPDSSFQTYFGKPAFAVYGNGNTNPVFGGPMYGNYLKTHNINPQRGPNRPKIEQVYQSAALASQKIKYGKNYVPLKRLFSDMEFTDRELDQKKNQLKFVNSPTKNVPKLGALCKPDLTKEKRFQVKDVDTLDTKKENRIRKKKKHNEIKTIGQNKKTKKNKVKKVHVSARKIKKPSDRERNKVENLNSKKNQPQLEDVFVKKNQPMQLVSDSNKKTPYEVNLYLQSKNKRELMKPKNSNVPEKKSYNKTLKKYELDPRNYKNLNSKALREIPFAGQTTKY